MYSTKRLLSEAKKIIQNGFSQGAIARDDNGYIVNVNEACATHFCLYGAFLKACSGLELVSSQKLAQHFKRVNKLPGTIGLFNDAHTKEQVLAALDKSIEQAED
jgi:hypothetical protein